MEDPGYSPARTLFEIAGANVVPVSIDEEGLKVGELERSVPAAKLVYVTPSSQFPIGVNMLAALHCTGRVGDPERGGNPRRRLQRGVSLLRAAVSGSARPRSARTGSIEEQKRQGVPLGHAPSRNAK